MKGMAAVNHQVRLASRPEGIPDARHFDITQGDIPEPGDGQALVRVEWLSVEPAMRGWVNAAANYSEPVPVGGVMRSLAAGTVVASRHETLAVGDRLVGWFGWQEWALTDGGDVVRTVVEDDLPCPPSSAFWG